MEDDGYVARDPESGKYTVGLRLVELGGIALSNMEFRHYGQLALDKLSAKLTMNANIGLLYEGDLMHIVFSVHEDAGLHHSVIGRRSPAHCTAMGKVLLASTWPGSGAQDHKRLRMAADDQPQHPSTSNGWTMSWTRYVRSRLCRGLPGGRTKTRAASPFQSRRAATR